MEKELYRDFVNILKEELVPAMGCTEPIAVAYCAAIARKTLNCIPNKVNISVSANIIKNVKSVIVPNTDGLVGIPAAAAAGIIGGDAESQLQVLSKVTDANKKDMASYIEETEINVRQSEKPYVLDIDIEVWNGENHCRVEIAGGHTNVVFISHNDDVILDTGYEEKPEKKGTDHSVLSVERIVEFADIVEINDIKDVLQRQIDYNISIAKEGLEGNYGANVGSILLKAYGNDVNNRAKAWAAAGSDARMNGCELPVIINSGSGNQGMTASIPVAVYAKEYEVNQDTLYRSLVVSNLITIHLKTGIGPLSAYCGATCAGCGAAAGIRYMMGGRFDEIAHVVVNSIAIDSGMICDGAKASCAAKIASAVEAGLLGLQMQLNCSEFYGGDGIVEKGVENTIKNVSILAKVGMKETDKTILDIMTC